MIIRQIIFALTVVLLGSAHAYAGEIKPRIPPSLTYDAALNDFFLKGALDSDRIVEIALANDPAAWHRYNSLLGDSFKVSHFIRHYRKQLRDRLGRHDDAGYRAFGVLIVDSQPEGQGGAFRVHPPGALDASLINPNLYGFARVRPALLIKQVRIDFPEPAGWHIKATDDWAERMAARDSDEVLRIDAVYDFRLTECQFRQPDRTLICRASFDRVEARARNQFDRAAPSDKRLMAEIQGPILGF